MAIRKGTLRAFDNGTKLASVQIDGSLSTYLANIPVSRELTATEMVAGRIVAVAFFDDGNPDDAMVIAVH